ncbi:MAG: hypothetical protein IPF42_19870 [Candidatus Microthrix sp.]|nr:hypothetical protein [Candidatus Microthrix sp.]
MGRARGGRERPGDRAGVLGNEEPWCRCPARSSRRRVYDHEDKYVTGSAELVIPASCPPRRSRRPNAWRWSPTGAARRRPGTGGLLLRVARRGLLLNEMNTMPGFTWRRCTRTPVGGKRRATELIDELGAPGDRTPCPSRQPPPIAVGDQHPPPALPDATVGRTKSVLPTVMDFRSAG